ncbi:MAG: B12-binding domain-containing radical SAM protein [Candidatus Helarchaeota archaeon]|nr:B12-binding domain-containing radical SAM protein [Candidatus Helarchaeota archaeon]
MRILLVNPTTRIYAKGLSVKAQSPLGLLCLAAVLREDGHIVKIFDHNVENNGLKDCFKFNPELVGFTSFTGPMILDGLNLSEVFRTHLEVPTVWGGVHPTLLPAQTVSDPRVDMCVVGEGEATIVELADCLENSRDLSRVKGLVWKEVNNGNVKIIENDPRPFIRDLDSLPFPAWDLIDPEKYRATSMGIKKSSLSLYSVQSSRGCPFQCRFCYNTIFNQQKWRFKSAERVIEEISYLKEKYKIERINFKDDNFVVKKKRVEKICRELYKNNLDVKFAADCRVDLLTTQLAKFLRLGGCEQLFFGVESGSPRILRFIRKGITLPQAMDAVKICKKMKIMSSASFVIGFPTETMEDIKLTQAFITRLNPDDILLKIFVPYPGSSLFDYSVKNHLFNPPQKLEDWALSWANANYQLSSVPLNMLNRLAKTMVRSFYIRKFPSKIILFLMGLLKNRISLHRILFQGVKIITAYTD